MKRSYRRGRVYQGTYLNAAGRRVKSPYWSIAYMVDGKERRETTPHHHQTEALKALAKRQAEVEAGVPVEAIAKGQQITFEDLMAANLADKKANKRQTRQLEVVIMPHLKRTMLGEHNVGFAGKKAAQITTATLTIYRDARVAEGAAPATANREMAQLKRGFNVQRRTVPLLVPWFPMVKEKNTRKGFFERVQWDAFKEGLAAVQTDGEYRNLFEVAYITGWRTHDELLPRRWTDVKLNAKTGYLRLEDSKNTEGREFPMVPELLAAFQAQRQLVDSYEKKLGHPIAHIFVRPDGHIVRSYTTTWNRVRAATKIDRVPHDFRRTAVRNLTKAGMDRVAAMAVVGMKTESIFRRYSIVDQDVQERARVKLATYHRKLAAERKQKQP